MNRLVVQKYAGTSVGNNERIKKIEERIARLRKEKIDIVVVVSAMAGETDKLLAMANQISAIGKDRDMDLLLFA